MQIKTAHTIISLSFLTLVIMTLQGCKLGYNKTPKRNASEIPAPTCAKESANVNLDENSRTVFKLLSDLTCNSLATSQDGVFMGQSLGNGNQIADDGHSNSYKNLITNFKDKTKATPALVSIDYEFERLYSTAELTEANVKLKSHWDAGGLVTITWTPLNPWVNAAVADDAESEPGSHEDTKYSNDVDLALLVDTSTDINAVWQKKLNAISNALLDLKSKGVTVLWRPLPEMNTNTYWWGLDANVIESDSSNASLYTKLWIHMYEDFKDKGLQNLLWVYSPGESKNLSTENASTVNITSVDRAYPGSNYVDVVAGIARNDLLNIKDYVKLKDMNKPLGMAEYSPEPGGQYVSGEDKMFNNKTYADRLNGSYNFVSYWVSWHSSEGDKRALVDNETKETTNGDKYFTDRTYIFNLTDSQRKLDFQGVAENKTENTAISLTE